MKAVEKLLPASIKAKAIRNGREYGWKKEDVEKVLDAARRLKLASLGGQVQFLLPDGTCELYWLTYDPSEKLQKETWKVYATRSIKESRAKFRQLCKSTDFVGEGIRSFDFLEQKVKEKQIDLSQYLTFIISLVDEREYALIEKMRGAY